MFSEFLQSLSVLAGHPVFAVLVTLVSVAHGMALSGGPEVSSTTRINRAVFASVAVFVVSTLSPFMAFAFFLAIAYVFSKSFGEIFAEIAAFPGAYRNEYGIFVQIAGIAAPTAIAYAAGYGTDFIAASFLMCLVAFAWSAKRSSRPARYRRHIPSKPVSE